jgi:hypothetical protein
MVTQAEIKAGRKNLAAFDSALGTLGLINEHGDLCRDGFRAVSHLNTLVGQIIKAIEDDEGIADVADELHAATNRISHGRSPS